MGKNQLVNAMLSTVRNEISGIHTAAPGEIVSYDPGTNQASVKPAIKKKVPDGRMLDFPVIVGVPVVWPTAAGGQASLTLPLKAGDGVLLVFSERSIDDWIVGGESEDLRQYDLTDAIAIPGCNNSAPAAGMAHPEDACLAFGGTSLRITPGGDVVVDGGDLIVGGISFKNHVHGGITPGGASTDVPK